MLDQVKVGDTIHVYKSMSDYNEEKVVRLTPKYVETEAGGKYRIADGQPSGTSRGIKAEPGTIAPVEEAA